MSFKILSAIATGLSVSSGLLINIMLLTIILSSVVTVVIIVVALNLLPGERTITEPVRHLYEISDPLFQSTIGHLLGPPLVAGNAITILKNGDQIFPAMLASIASAKHSICFESYIYWSGSIGTRFAEALAERAKAGVAVHVILDFVGSLKMERTLIKTMRDAGVLLVQYHPISWYTITKFNNRTHRKLLIVDGEIGYTGGVGIADRWLGNAESAEHWRDTQVRAEGPVVADLQSAFMDNWLKTKSQVLHGKKYFPQLVAKGSYHAQVFKSSEDEGSESARLLFLLSIAAAKKSIRISASYFVPDRLAIKTLCAAKSRGVEVEIILPGPVIDAPEVQILSRGLLKPMLKVGIKFFEYQPTMYHTKMMIIDGIWSSVGSTNFDNRSFRLNDEANLNCFDQEFALLLTADFAADKILCKEFVMRDFKARSRTEKLHAIFLRIFRSQF